MESDFVTISIVNFEKNPNLKERVEVVRTKQIEAVINIIKISISLKKEKLIKEEILNGD